MSFRERTLKTPALVLRRQEYGEADYLLTVFTPEHGKLTAIAKGARRTLSRKMGQVELYSLTELVISRGRNLHIIAQADMRDAFSPLREDLTRNMLAAHCVELLDAFAVAEEGNPAAFNLLKAALGWLCEPDGDLYLAVRYFEYRLLRTMGFEPSVMQCAISGEPLTAQDHYFCAAEGGVILPEYTAGQDVMLLPLPILKILRYFSREKWPKVRTLRLQAEHHTTLERVLGAYIVYLLERPPKSLKMLSRLQEDT
ncbi:MAG: DNA repair protein RecO [Anaerolineales bacterium]